MRCEVAKGAGLNTQERFMESKVKVRYQETDQMGVAHHSCYFVWFEIGRTDLCHAASLPYSEIEKGGYVLVVTEIACRYLSPFLYDEEVTIRTHVTRISSRGFRFEYELIDHDGIARATGSSSHIWLDYESRRPVKAPADMVTQFERFRGSDEDSDR